MKNKYMAIVSCALCLSMLTACAGSQTGGSDETNEQTAAAETTQQAGQQPAKQEQSAEKTNAEADADPSDNTEQTAELSRYIGEWYDRTSQRATMTIVPSEEHGGARVTIHWGSSAWQAVEWSLPVVVKEDGGLSYSDGEKAEVSYEEDGELTKETREVLRSDLEGTFTFDAEGNLLWTDEREENAADCVFERYQPLLPERDVWIDQYFRVVSGYEPGTAGASLAEAQVACAIFGFASDYQLWAADVTAMRDSMLAAWEGMSEKERSGFDANFIDVVRLIDDCLSDYEGVSGIFDDAGVGDRMGALLGSETARLSWSALCANTLTLGNSGETSESGITEEMAFEGVDNYCHEAFDWSVAEERPGSMYLEMGEESETEYQLTFRSYTGALTYFYVDKSTGETRMTEYVPALDAENEAGSFSLYDYLN